MLHTVGEAPSDQHVSDCLLLIVRSSNQHFWDIHISYDLRTDTGDRNK